MALALRPGPLVARAAKSAGARARLKRRFAWARLWRGQRRAPVPGPGEASPGPGKAGWTRIALPQATRPAGREARATPNNDSEVCCALRTVSVLAR